MMCIRCDVFSIIENYTTCYPIRLTNELEYDLELDEVALLEISDDILELFDIAIADDDLDSLVTVGNLVDLVKEKLN